MGIARTWSFLKGAMIGAGLMYLLDENSGGRRRALIRDKMILGRRKLRMIAEKRMRDLGNRVQGAWAERRGRVMERVVPDDVLEERVRAQLGHTLSHPGSIEVLASRGVVTVRGPVLRGEAEKIREKLERTRGVCECNIQVNEVDDPSSVPGLQGESRWQRKVGRRA